MKYIYNFLIFLFFGIVIHTVFLIWDPWFYWNMGPRDLTKKLWRHFLDSVDAGPELP